MPGQANMGTTTKMDSANFLTLAGRLVRDAIARDVLHPETGAAFMTTAQAMVRWMPKTDSADVSTVGMTQDAAFASRYGLTMEDAAKEILDRPQDDVKSARANAFARRARDANDVL